MGARVMSAIWTFLVKATTYGFWAAVIAWIALVIWTQVRTALARTEREENVIASKARKIGQRIITSILVSVVGLFGSFVMLFLTVNNDPGEPKALPENIIPKRYQGVYNAVSCKEMDTNVSVYGNRIQYPSDLTYKVIKISSDIAGVVKIRVRPAIIDIMAGKYYSDQEEDFSITYAGIGSEAMLQGSSYIRCSRY